MTKVVLLDIDGVLVHPGGYRAAVRATLNYFGRLMGLPAIDVPEEVLIGLEQRGISSEWDMVPLLLAAVWVDVLIHTPRQNLSADLLAASTEIRAQLNGYKPNQFLIPDFALEPGEYPAESALRSGCFSSIPSGLRKNILLGTRDVQRSHCTRLFQHYSLGSQQFSVTYGLPPVIETESCLRLYDRSNIDAAIRAKLRQADTYLCAFTARPSAPPREISTASLFGYAPEAEIALELVGLSDIPLIAFGKLQYLAAHYALDPAKLLKPSPVQALAAIAAAVIDDEWSALQSAGDWLKTNQLTSALLKLPRQFDLFVVEDTLGGIRSTLAAGQILREAGVDVTTHALGLTYGSQAKTQAFTRAGIGCFENWAELIHSISHLAWEVDNNC